MKSMLCVVASALVLIASEAHAQTTVSTPSPAASLPATALPPSPASSSSVAVLRSGTSVPLKMSEGLTTKGKLLRVGQRFNLEVAAPVSVDGRVVIPAGSTAVGEITDVRNKGMWGKSGRIGARLLYVRVGDRNIRLSGQLDDKGTTGTAGVVGAIAFVPVAGFFMTGTSAQIPLGAPVAGFIDEDVPLAFAAGSAPMTVPAAVVVPAAK